MRSAILALVLLAGPAAAQDNPRRFTDLVRTHFAQWDRNADHVISAEELNQLIQDPTYAGEEAAALATLRLAAFKQKAVLSLETLDRFDFQVANNSKRTPFNSYFDKYRARLARANQELFPAGQPDLSSIRQDRGGECYFLCVVGAMLARDPQTIRHMIQPTPGGYAVQFPGLPTVQVAPPTPTEIAFFDKDLDGGLWLLVLEKAFALRQNKRMLAEDMDAINSGGSISSAIKTLTAHGTSGFSCHTTSLDTIRNSLQRAFAAQALVGVASGRGPDTDRPKGVPYGHCWAVLSYDPGSDRVTLWNPWGHEQTSGYITHRGTLEVPLAEFARYWNRVVIERR